MADPHDADPELAAHLESCPECPGFKQRLVRFEGRLQRALKVDAGDPSRARTRVARGWLAMAASVLIALAVGGGLWLAVPHSSLAADVVLHMAGEPDAWARTDVAVPSSELDQVLEPARIRLRPDEVTVSYARSCTFRGHQVPHLVVQTDMGPVTVMVLEHEFVAKPTPFDQDGYRGVIVPVAGHGSLAVLARGPDADQGAVQRVSARVLAAIVWER